MDINSKEVLSKKGQAKDDNDEMTMRWRIVYEEAVP